MTDEELIARLRDLATNMFHSGSWGNDLDTTKDAADRIEALVKERDQWIEHTKNAVWSDSEELKLANDRIKWLEAAVTLAANRLHRRAVDFDTGSRASIETFEWAEEARAALKGADHV